MDFLTALPYTIGAILGWEGMKALGAYLKSPYRWRCDVCKFKVSSNDKAAVERIKKDHKHF